MDFNKYKKVFIASLWALPSIMLLLNFQNISYWIQGLLINPFKREEFFNTLSTSFQDFLTLTTGIIVEAMPFIVLGVLFSVAIQKWLTQEMLLKILPKKIIPRRLMISVLGIFMPVCECGNVPVARGLMVKGLNPQESMIFLLTAPSVNIVTFIVTWEAFGNINSWVAPMRVISTIIIANISVLVLSKLIGKSPIITEEFAAKCNDVSKKDSGYYFSLFTKETWLMTRMLVFGASVAAVTQVFVPRDTLEAIGSNIFLSVLAMIILAFVISICSTVDAFFALAYVGTFSLGSIMAFLVAGPMIDIKMIALMKTTYTTKAITIISASVITLTFLMGIILAYVW